MVKLSEIVRKNSSEKSQEEPALVSEALKVKENSENLPQVKKIYEDAILSTRLIMKDIRAGKTIKGSDVFSIAEFLVNRLRASGNLLLSLINIFSFYDERDDFLYSHSVNVSLLATNMGLALGYDESQIVDLCASSLLHDIGMLKIPEEIINKPSKLDEEEYKLIREHPAYGLELLVNIKDPPKSAPDVIYEHHEKVDGSGYPEGKKGEEISEYARIVALIEVYEALTHPRPYRKRKNIPYEGVKKIIQEERNSFDLRLVKIFLNFITPYPLGSFVLLNNGEIGRIIRINDNFPLRPVVELYFDAQGKPPERPARIDLTKSAILHIEKAIDESDL
jgi:HD-GYP domain-containing protein (c-di-GMP phosphodiesterase class II)